MKAIFIRHKLTSTPEILKEWWDKRIVALHYEDIPSTDPEDYKSQGKKALRRLWKYCATGAIVGATYRDLKPSEMLIGEILPGSAVKITQYDNLIYKTVQLENVQEISYRDFPLLSAIQPQGAITGWPSAQTYLEAILGKNPIPWSVHSLHPAQLEIICYEFLKMQGVIKALLMPIGRTLRDVDIYGLGENGKGVVAQVTHNTNRREIAQKIELLREFYSEDSVLIFFGPEAARVELDQIKYISIEKVFDTLTGTGENSPYYMLISKMLRWEMAC